MPNMFRAKQAKFYDEIAHPVDAETWYMSPLEVKAYYDPTANNFVLTAGILQPPLVKQFDEAKGNGKFSLGENIGNLVGLKSAYLSAFSTDSVGNVEERRNFSLKMQQFGVEW